MDRFHISKTNSYLRVILFVMLLLTVTNCNNSSSSSGSSTTSYSSSKPSGVISGVGDGVVATGSATGKSALGSNTIVKLLPPKNIFDVLLPKAFASGEGISGRCDSHAYPLVSGTSTRMNSSQADYGAMNFFCRIAKNTGDSESVQGSYSLLKAIACALENAGLQWDGVSHSVSVNIDSNCFSSSQITNIGASTMTITVTASKPAAFNSYYDAGAVLVVPSFGTYRLGAKVSGTKIEFGGSEDQSSIVSHKWGAYAGSYDTSTGDLRFETRSDRFGAAMSTGGSSCSTSCGFGFHMRLYAKLGFDSSGSPTSVSTVSGIIASIGRDDDSYSNLHGELITASGDLSSTGIKIRHYSLSGISGSGNISKLSDPTQYTENSSAEGCYTQSSNSANTCGTGITIGSSTIAFMQAGSLASGASGYTDAVSWLNSLTSGISFSTVNLSDSQ